VTERLLVDVGGDGRAVLSMIGRSPAAAEPVALDWALDAADAEDLRWYLEDYLRTPYGAYQERGERVAERLTQWGRAAFAALFESSSQARDMYGRLRHAGGDVEIILRSAAAEHLALPWELLADPERPMPLALDGVRIGRALPTVDLAGTFAVGGERLRVLMVISRPAGRRDVGYRMVARPLVQRLEAVRGEVDLVVLRPPTLDRLEQVLHAARAEGQPFQVVHFDGHGSYTDRGTPQGVLVFEQPGGGPDAVPADRIAAVLARAEVPVVVLNACQSGALGRQVEAAVATRLLQQGAAAVVAMAFSVYAVAAAEFMTAFYEQLFDGGQVADAVAAGRRRMAERNLRPSPTGPLPLQDWLVPVHYASRDVDFPRLRRARPEADTVPQRSEADAEAGDTLAAAAGEFVGRDGLFYELETASRLQKVVLLHGPAGAGKTEVVKAFARWWRDTGGVERPEWIFWHSFEPGVASYGLPGVLSAMGLRLFGADFARLDDEQRLQTVHQAMRQNRLLLIWDNLESAHTMPDPDASTPPLDEEGRRQLAEFLTVAATGASTVLITSRNHEEWLGSIRRIGISGLSPEEADEYTDALLGPYPRAVARRRDPAFADLLTRLDGHPLSMRLVLPHLDTTDADAILAGLRDGGDELLGGEGGGRTTSLAASIAYSYRHLTDDEQRALVAVGLFNGVASTAMLEALSESDGVPERFRGRTIDDWAALLNRATAFGLLTSVGAGMYTIPPALPTYLADQWRHQAPDTYLHERTNSQVGFLDSYAGAARWLEQQITGGDAQLALAIVGWQRQTLSSQLGYAVDAGQHDLALTIAVVLTRFWNTAGHYAEASEWTDRIRHAVEAADGAPPASDSPAGALWLLIVGAEANRETELHQLDAAEDTYRRIADFLATQPDTPTRSAHLSTVHHQLGMVAESRGELDAAEAWYHRSRAVAEELNDRPGLVSCYHQLGRIAELRRDLDTAETWYQRSLAINEELGNQRGLSDSYHQLGHVAELRRDLAAAETWYLRSLAIKEQLGDRPGLAGSYHQLGRVAEERRALDVAEAWYQRSLTINDQLGNRPAVARNFHQLGVVAGLRGELDTAEEWYRRALALHEQLDDRPATAATCHQIGLVADLRGEPDAAEQWCRRALAIKEELGDRPGMATTYQLLGSVAESRGDLAVAEAWYRRALTIDEELGNRSGIAACYHQLGTVAKSRGELDAAESWYHRAVTINVQIDNRPDLAMNYGQLGLIAEQRGNPAAALEWMVRSVTLFPSFPDPATGSAPDHLLRLTRELGRDALQAAWRRVTGRDFPSG
jgi:tetratricopeptide (TPR) repeat protein